MHQHEVALDSVQQACLDFASTPIQVTYQAHHQSVQSLSTVQFSTQLAWGSAL